MKTQATKASPEQVRQHIMRQRCLGERMIGESDQPKPFELFVTAVVVLVVLFGHARGWL
jgi:hypothetical protein